MTMAFLCIGFALLAIIGFPLLLRRLELESVICIGLFALVALLSMMLVLDAIGMLWYFLMLLAIGVVFVLVLFWQDNKENKQRRFVASERLIGFSVEILVAVIGFGITLFITNTYERNVEKERAVQMLTQTIEYTEKQAARDRSYLHDYDSGTISRVVFVNSSVINTEYYESILTNELVSQNANMSLYGEIMNYLVWIEEATQRAKTVENDQDARTEMYTRYADVITVRDFLVVTRDELAGDITTQEAEEKREEIYLRSREDTIKQYESRSAQ